MVEDQHARVTLCRSNAGVLACAVAAARESRRPHVAGGIREPTDEIREAQALYEVHVQDIPDAPAFKRFATWQELREEPSRSATWRRNNWSGRSRTGSRAM